MRAHCLLFISEWSYTILILASILNILNSKWFFVSFWEKLYAPTFKFIIVIIVLWSNWKGASKKYEFSNCIIQTDPSKRIENAFVTFFWCLEIFSSFLRNKFARIYFDIESYTGLLRSGNLLYFHTLAVLFCFMFGVQKSIICHVIFNAYVLFHWNLSL